jgi:hypothetical protein
MIDEGNLIYLFDLGINAAQAQAEVFAYLQWENELIKEGKAPEHHHTVQWLEACADKWAHCPERLCRKPWLCYTRRNFFDQHPADRGPN